VALIRQAATGALLLGCLPSSLRAQATPEPIRDNSVLIEEAYNQDGNVV